MKLQTKAIYAAVAFQQAVAGAPLVKSLIMTIGADNVMETGAYDVASVGASFAVEHTGLFGPLLKTLPGVQVMLGAAGILGGRFAGATVGGIASKAVQGFIEGEAGNNHPLIGWIIRDEAEQSEEQLEIAHSIGYDVQQAVAAGAAVSDGIRGLVNGVTLLDQFKPIIHPDTVSSINTVETFGGLVSSLVGWVIKLAIEYIYTSDLLNDTPYIGELIRNADAMIKPEFADLFKSADASSAMAEISATPSLI
ncbi:hypothetical protein LPJ74_006029 [Coemansia sp. RSA 1843]|nr:hypothetical protein LPJ74_006029 [Coemansia sp. RSA 1843]